MAFFNRKRMPEKLHICLISKKFPYLSKDTESGYFWSMARGLAKRGHSVVVLSLKNPMDRMTKPTDNIQTYFLGEEKLAGKKEFSELVLNKFLEIHQSKPFHVVHSIDDSGILIGRERKKYGVTMTYDVSATQMAQIFSIQGMAQDTVGSLLSTGFALIYKFLTTYLTADRKILKTADGVFVATPQQKIMLERYYLYPELKIYVVPYGMEQIELEPRHKPEELRSQLGLSMGSQVVLTFTDMTEFDELANLFRAFQKVVVKRPGARLVVVGNGPLFKEVEFAMLNLALGSKVIFAGTIATEDLSDYISLADVFVNLSSRTTGFEPTMLDAMAQKKVVIGSELSPMATIIEDGKDGFLLRPADITSLTDLIGHVFGGQISAAEVGERARQKVIDLFDVNKMVEQMLHAFREVLLRSGRLSSQTRPDFDIGVAPRAGN